MRQLAVWSGTLLLPGKSLVNLRFPFPLLSGSDAAQSWPGGKEEDNPELPPPELLRVPALHDRGQEARFLEV